MGARRIAVIAVVACAACAGGPHDEPPRQEGPRTIAIAATPDHASMFGGSDLVLAAPELADLAAVEEVTVGNIRALDARRVPGGISVRIQGAPTSGPAPIVVRGAIAASGSASFRGATFRSATSFRFDPPASGAPARWMAFGASLTHGAQSGGLDAHGQTNSYAAQLARAAGVYLGLPLVVDGLVPPIRVEDVVKDCNATANYARIVDGILGHMWDPGVARYDLRKGRQDPTLAFQNLAIGGSTLKDVIEGGAGPVHILERVMQLPDGDPEDFGAPTPRSQLARIVANDPDVLFSADLLGNDAIAALGDDDVLLERATTPELIEERLRVIIDALGRLRGQVFLGTLVDITVLPRLRSMGASRIARGLDTEATFDAKVGALRARVAAYNAALVRVVALAPNVHVVDLAREADPILRDGYEVDGVRLASRPFGGLLSFDHLHFSDTGYAILAGFFARAINAQLGIHIPEIDLAAVMARDPFSPTNLRAAGVRCGDAR